MWTIIAALAVIVLTAIGIIAAFNMSNSGQAQMNAQNIIGQLGAITSSISAAYAQNPNFQNMGADTVKALGGVPASWQLNGTGPGSSLYLGGGGVLKFATDNLPNGGTNNSYDMQFSGLSSATCVAIATYNVPQLVKVTVNGTSLGQGNPAFGLGGPWPVTPDMAQSACGQNAQNNSVTLQLAP